MGNPVRSSPPQFIRDAGGVTFLPAREKDEFKRAYVIDGLMGDSDNTEQKKICKELGLKYLTVKVKVGRGVCRMLYVEESKINSLK